MIYEIKFTYCIKLRYQINNKYHMTILYSQQADPVSGGIAAFLPFILIGLIFYFLIIRPQSNQRKKHDLMLKNIKKGDKIITRGGIYGKIVNFQGKNNNKVTLEVSPNNKIILSRSYIVGYANIENNEVE